MVLIKRTDEPIGTFFSLKVGRDFGSGLGGWTSDKEAALGFARPQDARAFADAYLPQLAPFCEPVVTIDGSVS